MRRAAHDGRPGKFTTAVVGDPEVEEMQGRPARPEETDPDELRVAWSRWARRVYSGTREAARPRSRPTIARMIKHNDRRGFTARMLMPEDASEADENKVITVLAD
jgi:hypothetical protein